MTCYHTHQLLPCLVSRFLPLQLRYTKEIQKEQENKLVTQELESIFTYVTTKIIKDDQEALFAFHLEFLKCLKYLTNLKHSSHVYNLLYKYIEINLSHKIDIQNDVFLSTYK